MWLLVYLILNNTSFSLTFSDPPDGPPVVRGQKLFYHPGEVIRLNCTSYRSNPAPQLTWTMLKDLTTSSLSSNSPSFAFLKSSTTSSSLFFASNSSSTSRRSPHLSSFASTMFKFSSALKSLSLFKSRNHGDGRFHDNDNVEPDLNALERRSLTSANDYFKTGPFRESKMQSLQTLNKGINHLPLPSNYTKVNKNL